MAGRFHPLVLITVTTGLLLATGCGGASLGTGDDNKQAGPVKIGLLVPQSGTYKALGDDMKQGFELYVRQHGGRLGGREVQIVTADEGETADSGKAAAEKLVKQDRVLAVSGVVSSATVNGVKDLFETSRIPLVGSNASPTTLTGTEYIWRTSYVNDEPGKALGRHVAERAGGPVFLIAAGYQAGKDEIEGFKSTFLPAGGKIAGEEVYTPFPGTKNFQPYLSQIENSGAKAVFCFYAGGAAVDFVKQYRDFGLAGKIPLYAPGFLTEGGVLKGQGDAAEGILTALNYSADLDNAANRQFAPAYRAAHGTDPTTYAMASWDAAQVLDKAIGAAGSAVTPETVNAALSSVGDIDSPRGTWRFNSGGTPIQPWYLREVKLGANTVAGDLGRLGG
ncbi:ABC transporter substrate-binding protein [Streptomyces nojiriensis]|uniref:ABC transporter substrate-binding protein n=2 Tax=Streptomyces nojiriensis TaxID=66374 RepID=A0ABQ3SKP1_9ACTN|nr:ABC transporter substrate-binding protein [Streptomyces nojiriensis]QTI50119.1 Aliphatic amidase expression-regulating protein [Streptomyces nojiriensis]GGS22981.1 ABC transporter substrate-binding protein [Streptomyces nojiriensis]GHI68522.1 ABC transporter substrate-binding protein [Streptomyces nojiriensis]